MIHQKHKERNTRTSYPLEAYLLICCIALAILFSVLHPSSSCIIIHPSITIQSHHPSFQHYLHFFLITVCLLFFFVCPISSHCLMVFLLVYIMLKVLGLVFLAPNTFQIIHSIHTDFVYPLVLDSRHSTSTFDTQCSRADNTDGRPDLNRYVLYSFRLIIACQSFNYDYLLQDMKATSCKNYYLQCKCNSYEFT